MNVEYGSKSSQTSGDVSGELRTSLGSIGVMRHVDVTVSDRETVFVS